MMKVMTAAAIVVGMASAAFAKDPIEGLWKTPLEDGIYYHIQMKPCGSGFCGSYKTMFENGTSIPFAAKGKNAVYDMVSNGDGTYVGTAWKASTDKTYKGKGSLNGNSLTIGGCILGGIICLKQIWQRVN